jgi:deazaflavin-dependent oxidoreductase (nitroreductase family)
MMRLGKQVVRWGPAQRTVRFIAPRVDPTLLRLSRGRISTAVVTPQLLLTHTGAKSGLRRTTPLIYFTDRDRVILVASNFGEPRHPAWYHNVKADPRVSITVHGRTGAFIGTEITGDERDRLWGLATQFIPSYLDYERTATPRRIPIVAFTPAAAGTQADQTQ